MAENEERLSESSPKDEVASERAYRDEHERSLREFDAKMDALVAKARGIASELKTDFENESRTVSERRRRFEVKLARLRDASGDAWVDLKKGVEDSWDELEDAFGDFRKGVNSAVGRFKERPRP